MLSEKIYESRKDLLSKQILPALLYMTYDGCLRQGKSIQNAMILHELGSIDEEHDKEQCLCKKRHLEQRFNFIIVFLRCIAEHFQELRSKEERTMLLLTQQLYDTKLIYFSTLLWTK